jgi:ubiquinone biosynthesis protein COQ4
MIQNLRTLVDATRKALADPKDTKQAFRIAEALAFRAPERITKRYKKSLTGAARLESRTPLLQSLCNREALAALPEDTLGAHYLRFLDAEGITPDGLIEASEEGAVPHEDPEVAFVTSEMRDLHDLWHVVTGYQTDLLGEAAVLAFSSAQLRHPGVGFLAGIALVLTDMPYYRRFILDAFKKGRNAAWLPAQPWEKYLAMPIDEVRARLGIEPVGPYAEVREQEIASITVSKNPGLRMA